MPLVHLDTDFGGDMDDLCALAMLLRWPGVELSGVTTVADVRGKRAGYARYVLELEGRGAVPLAAGVDAASPLYREYPGLPDEASYWPEPVDAAFSEPQAALELLKDSIARGVAVIGIGPYTNLALLEQASPGILAGASLFLMGGYVSAPRTGYPQWGREMDYNIQADVTSALYVLERADPLLIPLSVTVETALRRAYLPGLRSAGALGALIARQAEAFALEYQNETRLAPACPALPADIINFQHDPLACAIALGWREGVEIETIPLRLEVADSWLAMVPDPAGKPFRVVTRVDGTRFSEFWLERITGAR